MATNTIGNREGFTEIAKKLETLGTLKSSLQEINMTTRELPKKLETLSMMKTSLQEVAKVVEKLPKKLDTLNSTVTLSGTVDEVIPKIMAVVVKNLPGALQPLIRIPEQLNLIQNGLTLGLTSMQSLINKIPGLNKVL